jgi:hypothetical protein
MSSIAEFLVLYLLKDVKKEPVKRIKKPTPVVKYVKSLESPVLVKETVCGMCLVELPSEEHCWVSEDELTKLT